MLAYRLRHRIAIQTPTEVQNSTTGEMVKTYADLYPSVPAEVLTGAGRKSVSSGTEQNDYDCRINIRWFNITLANLLDCRIVWDGRIYNIISAEQDLTARREWRLMCKGGIEVYQNVLAATALRFVQQPTDADSGEMFAPPVSVEIVDEFGNRVVSGASSTANVTIAIATGTGTLNGTLTVAAVAGLATFYNVNIEGDDDYTLTATSAGLTAATSNEFTVTGGAIVASAVKFVQQPTDCNGVDAFSPVVTVEIVDSNGTRIDTTDSITIAIASGTDGTLTGSTTVACVAGLATFTGLTLESITSGSFTLVAFRDGLEADVSDSFNMVSFNPSQVAGLSFGFDVADISTLFEDSAGTTPVTADNDPVGKLLDLSPNGYNGTQPTSGQRPIYNADGTYHWLSFAGTGNEQMDLNPAHDGAVGSDNWACFGVRVTASGFRYIIGNLGDDGFGVMFVNGLIRPYVDTASGAIGGNGSTNNTNNDVVVTVEWNRAAGTLKAWINQTLEVDLSGTPADKLLGTAAWLGQGANATAAEFAGRMYTGWEYTTIPSASDKLKIEQFVAARMGVTL